MMTRTRKTLLVAVTALMVAGSVAGVALATGGRSKTAKPAAPAVEVTTPDTDDIQSGDQTSPDTVSRVVRTSGGKAKSSTSASETGVEDPSTETGVEDPSTETGVEDTGSTSDGPGGHEDPPGQDVNHEFNGEE